MVIHMNNRDARIKAMQILYTMDFDHKTLEEAAEFVFYEGHDELAYQYAFNCVINLEKIDDIISRTLVNYSLTRLNLVDKAIVRLAVSEMLTDTPREIIINEALEITKIYSDQGDKKATGFNNRLLDNINNALK